ncbi:MAG: four helix bundle protein [Candidatus Aminicenantes bacterium]
MNVPMELENNRGWREARDLTAALYRVSVTGNLSSDGGLREALRQSATAVMSHISLGQKGHEPEFCMVQLYYARASAATLFTLLSVSREAGYVSEGNYLDFEDRVHRICDHIDKMLKKFESLLPEKRDYSKWLLDSHEL